MILPYPDHYGVTCGQLQRSSGKSGTSPGVLVFEKHVGCVPGLRPNSLDPLGELLARVALTPQADVAPAGSVDQFWTRRLIHIGDAQGAQFRPQALEHVVVEPTRVPEFESHSRSLADEAQEGFESREILLEIGRQLEQDRASAPFSAEAARRKSFVAASAFFSRLKCVIACGALRANRKPAGTCWAHDERTLALGIR